MTNAQAWLISEQQDLSLETPLQALPLWRSQIDLSCPGQDAIEIFQENPRLPGILLTGEQQYKGMISRRQFFEKMSRPFGLEIFSKRPLHVFCEFVEMDTLVLPQTMLVVEAVKQALGRSVECVYEPIVVETEDSYAILDAYQLLLAYSDLYGLALTTLKDTEVKATKHEKKLKKVLNNQAQLIQTEKMLSLEQLVAGIAHEINNPVNFISGNITYIQDYIQALLSLMQLYQQRFPNAGLEIQAKMEEIDLDFLMADLPKLLTSMRIGVERIQEIVFTLRNFSRLDEAEIKAVDIHEGIESTLLLLRNRLKATLNRSAIEVIKEYGDLPLVECYVSQLNQVFMNLLVNAIDALEVESADSIEAARRHAKTITIRTQQAQSDRIAIQIADNGCGMSDVVKQRLFDPFFTTKPVGQGTGLGLSISYQIVTKQHKGVIRCDSEPEKGTTFWIEIPVQQHSTPLT
jgi:signal transduction histidine kinase